LNIRIADIPSPDFIIDIVPRVESITDRYAFMLADNRDIPIEVRTASAHGCDPMDSHNLVYNPTIPLEVREVAAHHCNSIDSYGIAMEEAFDVRIRTAAAHHCIPENSFDIAINGGLDIGIRAAAARHCAIEACASILYNTKIPIEVRKAAAKTPELGMFLKDSVGSQSISEKSEQSSIVLYEDSLEERQPPVLDEFSRGDERWISLSRGELFAIASNPDEPLDVRCGAAYLLK
jgi:hypothetical protein